jgi:hypothetical protein
MNAAAQVVLAFGFLGALCGYFALSFRVSNRRMSDGAGWFVSFVTWGVVLLGEHPFGQAASVLGWNRSKRTKCQVVFWSACVALLLLVLLVPEAA